MSGSSDHKLSENLYPMASTELRNRNLVMSGSSDQKISRNYYPETSIEVLNRN